MDAEDLAQLKQMQQNFANARIQLGDIVSSMSRLEQKKKSLLFDIDNKSSELQNYVSSLEEKYGKSRVNLETGELTASDNT